MTTDPGPTTVRSLLFGRTPGDAAEALAQQLAEHDVAATAHRGLRHLTRSGREAVDGEIGRVTADLLEIDIGDALVAGWLRYSVLRAAARRTLLAPGSEEVVALASHRVTSAYRPSIDLLVDGLKVNSFELELAVALDVLGVAAVMRAGQLVALRGGTCRVELRLSLEGLPLLERERTMDLALVVRLRTPVTFVAADESAIPRQRPAAPTDRLTGSPAGGADADQA